MKRVSVLGLAAVGLLTVLLQDTAAGEGGKVYVVRPGDTLGGIAGKELGDRTRWKEIQRGNPQVTNPHLIFPGDTLVLPIPAGEVAAQPQEAPAEVAEAPAGTEAVPEVVAGPAEAEVVEPALPVEFVRDIPVVSQQTYRTAGWIAETLPRAAIVATVEGKKANADGDAVIVSIGAESGTRFTVVRAERRVFHPRTRAPLGWLVRVLGTAEVTCPGTTTATAVLARMRDYATVGDLLLPYDPDDVLEENLLPTEHAEPCLSAGPADAMIVAAEEDRLGTGEGEIVLLDAGRAVGVVPGTRFYVYRELRPEGRTVVGEVQVIKAGERTATALITASRKEIVVADLLRAH